MRAGFPLLEQAFYLIDPPARERVTDCKQFPACSGIGRAEPGRGEGGAWTG